MATPVDFPKYLQFLVDDYQQKQHLYTLTDLQVEVEVEIPPEDRSQFLSSKKKPETKIDRLEVLTGLRKYVQQGNVLLVGKPGSGKSTVLQRFRWELALEALENADRQIPVLVELRYDQSIIDAICAEFENAQLNVSPEEVNDLRVRGKLLLLLDGVNEIPSQKRRQELQRFHDKNSHTRMIFTTRDLALGGSLGIEKKLEMCALTEAQMREFVGKYLPQHGDLLLRQLGNRLREVAETPLLLQMMCQVFKNSGKIPQSKGELFQEFDRLYDEFKGAQSVSEDFRRFKSDLLQQLAFVMLQGDSLRPTDGWVAISRDRAERILECGLRDRGVVDAPTKAKEWLEDLLEHHLLQVAAKREEIEFHHQLFQEYYAGRALRKLLVEGHIDAIDDRRLQHFYLNYFKWTEPLAFMLSLLADEDRAVRVVRLALDVDLILGARLAGEVQRVFQQRTVGLVDGLDVPGWLKVALLGEVRSDQVIPGLLKLVEHSDSDVRSSAVYALGKIGTKVAISGLLKLVEHSNSEVRWMAADALGKIGSEAAIPGLLKLVEHSNCDVRRRVADALGKIGSDVAIPGLLKLVEDSDFYVRRRVANALGKIGSEVVIPGLIKLVQDLNYDVRNIAAIALGEMGYEEVISELLELVETSNSTLRWMAADALCTIGSKIAISGLIKLVEHSDSNVRLMATYALCKIDYEAVIPGLIKLVEHSESYVRSSVAYTLGEIGSKMAISGLIKLVEDSDSDVRWMAIYALYQIDYDAAISEWLKLLEDSNSDVRWMAADALGKTSSNLARPGLLKLVEDPDSDVRLMAADALNKIDSEAAISGGLKLLEDSDSDVRISVADAGKIGYEAAIPGWLKLIEDSDSDVRRRAAYALGKIAKQHTEKLVSHLPHFLTLIPSKSGEEVHRLILTIQAACKYYNYPIRELRLPLEATKANGSAGLTINGNVGNLNTGTVNVKGDQIGTQHNIHPKN